MAKMTDHEVRIYNEGYNNGLERARTEVDRDSFAIAALQGILTTCAAPYLFRDKGIEVEIAVNAYAIADAMLQARTRDRVTE